MQLVLSAPWQSGPQFTPRIKQMHFEVLHFAVLLQGETSVGKTSMVTYLAEATGNTCIRVNNHEHTGIL